MGNKEIASLKTLPTATERQTTSAEAINTHTNNITSRESVKPPSVVVNWQTTTSLSPQFRRLMSLLLSPEAEEEGNAIS